MSSVSLFQSAGTLGGKTPALFRTAAVPPVVEQQKTSAVVLIKQEPSTEAKRSTTAVTTADEEPASTTGSKRKREEQEEEEEEEKEEPKKPKRARTTTTTTKNKKKQSKAAEDGDDAATTTDDATVVPKESTVEHEFYLTTKALLSVFRQVSGGAMSKILKFEHLRPAKSKGGLARLHETISRYYQDMGAKIRVYGDIGTVYKQRMLKLIKDAMPEASEPQQEKLADLFGEAMKNEALMIAMHTDTECSLCVTKALQHLATLPPAPSVAAAE